MKIAQKTPRKARKTVLEPLANELREMMFLSGSRRRVLDATGDITTADGTITVYPPVWWPVSDPQHRDRLHRLVRRRLGDNWRPRWPDPRYDIGPVTFGQVPDIPTSVPRSHDTSEWPIVRIGQTHGGTWVRANLTDRLMVVGRSGSGKTTLLALLADAALLAGAEATFIGVPGTSTPLVVPRWSTERIVEAIRQAYASMCDGLASLAADETPRNPRLVVVDDAPIVARNLWDAGQYDALVQLSDLIMHGHTVGHHVALGTHTAYPTDLRRTLGIATYEHLRTTATIVATGLTPPTAYALFGRSMPDGGCSTPGRASVRPGTASESANDSTEFDVIETRLINPMGATHE